MHSIKFKLLIDCEYVIPMLAELWYSELGQYWVPDASIEKSCGKFLTHLNQDTLPLTQVAFINDKPVAMASLRKTDGILPALTPWLGSLVVHPDYRKQGWGVFLKNFDYTNELVNLKCETLILWGENEWIMPKSHINLACGSIPHCTLKIYPKCMYMLWIDQWDKFVKDALNFLKIY